MRRRTRSLTPSPAKTANRPKPEAVRTGLSEGNAVASGDFATANDLGVDSHVDMPEAALGTKCGLATFMSRAAVIGLTLVAAQRSMRAVIVLQYCCRS